MKFYPLFLIFVSASAFLFQACAQKQTVAHLSSLPQVIKDAGKYNALDDKEKYVILEQGTEYPFSSALANNKEKGVYLCKQCNLPLFQSDDKFDSGTGWPSFDDVVGKNVKELTDADGSRTEIVCANCNAHLGHVFRGEGFTPKLTRHCANGISLNFVPAAAGPGTKEKPAKDTDVVPIREYITGKGYEKYQVATFAGGCFWCTEESFDRINGVVDVISGYSGGKEQYPTYEEVSSHGTTHAEAIVIYFDPQVVKYETLLEVFFVAHDPTQLNRQGPDVGEQYRSAIFYHNEEQKAQTEAFIKKQTDTGKFAKPIVTLIEPYSEFWVAEAYHQDYYGAHPGNPYIQNVSKPKVEKVSKTFANILKEKYHK